MGKSHYGEQDGGSKRRLKTQLLHHLEIPLLGHLEQSEPYLGQTGAIYIHCSTIKSSQDTQVINMSMDRWIKKMCYIHGREYYRDRKQDAVMPCAAAEIDLGDGHVT